MTIDSNTGLIQLYTADSNTVGTHTATVTVKLASYLAVIQTTTFTITIENCLVTSLTMSALNSQTYIIGDPILFWPIPGLTVTQVPGCGYSLTLSSLTASAIVTAPVVGASN